MARQATPSARRTARPHRAATAASDIDARVRDVLAWLERRGTRRNREGMARYGIVVADGKVFGVSMTTMRPLLTRLGRSHAVAVALWETGWYEGRVLAALVDEPALMTAARMDHLVRAFDNWALCDAFCFHLFDRTPHAWRKVEQWSRRKEEFVKRAAFATLAGISVHDKTAPDARFLGGLALIERAATDPRNFVKKAVNWALRSIGKRNVSLHASALEVAHRLSASADPAARWVGKGAVRELESAAVRGRLAARAARTRTKVR